MTNHTLTMELNKISKELNNLYKMVEGNEQQELKVLKCKSYIMNVASEIILKDCEELKKELGIEITKD